ncbi:MAG TPA: DUF5011 domain-containing protein [Pyrinomonadaceae bacterium]|jgi:hypothetical protein
MAVLLPAVILTVFTSGEFGTPWSGSTLGKEQIHAITRQKGAESPHQLGSSPVNERTPTSIVSGPISISLIGSNPLKTECQESFVDPGATAVDSAGKNIPVEVSGNVDTATLGTYTLTYTAADAQDSASAERTVNVVDTIAPVIALKGGRTTTAKCGETFVDPGASALDSCAGSVPVTISGSVDSNIQGKYTITYMAVDASNNTRTVTRTVIVGSIEDNPPTIQVEGRSIMTIECGSSFTDPGATAFAPCSGSVPVSTSGAVDPGTIGDYTIKYAAAVGELKSESARVVSVVDTQAPIIALNGDDPLTVLQHSKFSDPGAIARDGCAGEFAANASSNVDPNRIGTYTITYTASDPSGNEATPVKRRVDVVDSTQKSEMESFFFANRFPEVCKLAGLSWGPLALTVTTLSK